MDWNLIYDKPGALSLSREELLAALLDASKLWLAHDGLWFQEVEKARGQEDAIEADANAWRVFTVLEAKRIMSRLGIRKGEGLPALAKCLSHRLYSNINEQRIEISADEKKLRLTMVACRVQEARRRKGLPDFPCSNVGIVEYSEFASAVDPGIRTSCEYCPPGETPEGSYCRWIFGVE